MYFNILKNHLKKSNYRITGFSIIEMMIVLVIIGMVVTLTVSGLSNTLSKAKIKAAQIKAYNLSRTLQEYKLHFGDFPSEKEGWYALINPPDGLSYLDEVPKDPWNEDFVYIYPGDHNSNMPDILSRGPDRIFSDDDIGNWEK